MTKYDRLNCMLSSLTFHILYHKLILRLKQPKFVIQQAIIYKKATSMDKKCLIISGGEFSDSFPKEHYDLIVACDKGYEYAQKLDIVPDIIVGDFDSFSLQEDIIVPFSADISSGIISHANGMLNGIPVIKLPCRKNDSDTGYAVKAALMHGFKDITIACAMGGRFDHTISNIQTGSYIARSGGRASLYGELEIIHIFSSGSLTLPRKDSHSISVFSLTPICSHVSISGSEYDIIDTSLSNCYPIGLSNEWREEKITVTVGEGIIMTVQCRIDQT